MRKLIYSLLAVLLLASFAAGCADGQNPPENSPEISPETTVSPSPAADTLTGATDEILTEILDKANSMLGEDNPLPGSFETEITSETCEYELGLTPEEFSEYVTDAYSSTAMISTFAHEIALVKCVDAEAAQTVKELIAAGFDPWKWVCVSPEKCYVVTCGSYVLLVAAQENIGLQVMIGFSMLGGEAVGESTLFYTRGEDAPQ